MLVEYGVRNYFSFKEGVSVSFKVDTKYADFLFNDVGYSSVVCVKGANASGKTNLLKGLSFLSTFCTESFTRAAPSDEIVITSHFRDEAPTDLYAEFIADGKHYLYEISLTDKEVISEKISVKSNKRMTRFIERTKNELVYVHSSLMGMKTMKLRNNVSLISTAHQYELSGLDSVYRFFYNIYANVNFGGLNEIPVDILWAAEFLHNKPELLKFVSDFISDCDTGVDQIEIMKREEEEETKYYPIFVHHKKDNQLRISHYTESSGTKTLFRNLIWYKFALDVGGIVLADEFDMNLHPDILPKIVMLFLDPKSNPNHAQLICSTHDTEILDLVGRHRSYLVNKEDNESFAYRVDDIPGDITRNDRPLSPVYRAKKIGGVPKL